MPSHASKELADRLRPFATCFTAAVWRHVLVLVAGALLAPGRRTVTAALRVMALDRTASFAVYHRVLSTARWSARAVARRLLLVLVTTFVRDGPVVVGIDDTIERRWGARIEARGIYRDPVRSSRGHFVKASGLRWITVMLLAPIPWAGRVWALPFLTALAPSERFAREHGRRHKRLTDRARQLLLLVARWLPGRRLVAVADSSYAVIELLAAVCRRLTVVTRLRLDARLFDPPPPRRPGTRGRPRLSGARQPTLAERLADPGTRWRRVTVAGWYGRTERRIDLISGTALWHHPGKRVSVRWLLVRDVADDRNGELLLQLRQGRGGGGVARGDDELHALTLQERADLAGEASHLVQRARPVRKPSVITEVEEILVRKRDEALVEDGQPAHSRVEDAHRPPIHTPIVSPEYAGKGCSAASP